MNPITLSNRRMHYLWINEIRVFIIHTWAWQCSMNYSLKAYKNWKSNNKWNKVIRINFKVSNEQLNICQLIQKCLKAFLFFWCHWASVKVQSNISKDRKYSVFHVIVLQEQGWCELVLGLIVSLKASMWPQDWEEISFRSETLWHWFYSEPDRGFSKGRISGSGKCSSTYRVSNVQDFFFL